MDETADEKSQAAFAKKNDAVLLHLRPSHAQPATLYLSPGSRAKLPGGLSLDPLMRVAELGMDVKNKNSHRAMAVLNLIDEVKKQEIVFARP